LAPPLLSFRDVSLSIGNKPLFIDLELHIGKGERICLVGRNGTGKSTLMKTIAGTVEPDDGEIFIQPGTHTAYLPQEVDLTGFETINDYVNADPGTDAHKTEALLMELGIDGNMGTTSLSGGETRRAALVRALVSEPDILLLDEPTNHLDMPAIEWLEEKMSRFRGGFVVVSHDRAFLNKLARTTFWLDRGVVRRLDKGFSHFEAWSEEVLEHETIERSKLDKKIAEETLWSRQGISARRTRNQGRLRNLYALRKERSEQIAQTGKISLGTDSGGRSGKLVFEAENISKKFDGVPVINEFSIRVLRGARVGIVGPNGAGKTTLLRMLTGEYESDTGSIKRGTNLTPTYIDQKRIELNPDLTVMDYLCDAGGDTVDVRGTPKHIAGYLREYLFDAGIMRSSVAALSGGERNRLLLAKTLAKPTNLLILDEPTNDLDLETLDLLQEVLTDYDGTLLLVSHDRDFIDRIVSSTVVLDGTGMVEEFVGGYSDYVTQSGHNLASTENGQTKKQKNKIALGKPTPTNSKKKLNNKQRHLLSTLPGQIEQIESEIAALEKEMSVPSIDHGVLMDKAALLEQAGARLSEMEESWLEVEMIREEIEGS